MFKFVVNQRSLSENLSLASLAVPSRPSHPILANLKLALNEAEQTATLTGFNLAMSVETTFPLMVMLPIRRRGQSLSLPSLIQDIISKLSDGELTLETDETDLIKVGSASGNYGIRGMGIEEFPDLPEIKNGTRMTIPVDLFLTGLKYTLFSASTDESKQVLTGVRITIQPEGMEFASTDGHRLSVINVTTEPTEDDETTAKTVQTAEVTIPGKSLETLGRLLEKQPEGGQVVAIFDEGQAIFEMGASRLTSRLLEGQYPNYQQLVPRQFSRQVTVDRKSFLKAVELMAVVAELKNNIINLSLNTVEQTLTLEADAQDVGNGKETLPAQISGDDVVISFNAKYLSQALKIITTQEVLFNFNTATSPAVINPIGGDKFSYLLMPVQIRS